MQIGISTASFFTRMQTEDTLEAIAQMGAVRYEAFLSGSFEYEKEFAVDLNSRQRALGLCCTAVHALGSQFEPQLFSIADRQRRAAEEVFRRVLDAAATMGAPLYVMHGLFQLKRSAWLPDAARWAERLAQLTEFAQSYDVRLTLENVHWCMYSHSGIARTMESYLGNCAMGYTLDVKQALQSGETIASYLADMGHRLCNVHLCDVMEVQGMHHTCLPGKGQVDFASLASSLAKQNPNMSVTMEVYAPDYQTVDELMQSYRWLCQIFEQNT